MSGVYKMSYMGVDLGTSGCKVIIIDDSGRILASAKHPYRMIVGKGGFFELSPSDVLVAFKRSVRKALSIARYNPVEAIAFSALGEAFLLIDKNKKTPLSNILLPMDFRGLREFPSILEKIDEPALYVITGQPLHPMYSLPKILWLKRERPDLYEEASNILCVGDFLVFTLTDQLVTDYSSASRTMCFDIQALGWSTYLLRLFSLDKELFPQPLPIGTVVAPCKREWQEELGFLSNTLVVTGGFDQVIAAIGAGVTEEGVVSDSIGTTECVGFVAGMPLSHQEAMRAGYQNNCFIDHTYFINGGSLNGAVVINWLRENICTIVPPQESEAKESFFQQLEADLDFYPAPVYFLPYLSGKGTPYLDPLVKGALFGLDLSVDIKSFFKAFLESSCFEVMSNIRWIEREIGNSVQEIRVFGGGSKSEYWLKLKSEVTGKRISKPSIEDTSPFGAAIVAMAAKKNLPIREVVKSLVRETWAYEPKGIMLEAFQKKYEKYLILMNNLLKVWSEISKEASKNE